LLKSLYYFTRAGSTCNIYYKPILGKTRYRCFRADKDKKYHLNGDLNPLNPPKELSPLLKKFFPCFLKSGYRLEG